VVVGDDRLGTGQWECAGGESSRERERGILTKESPFTDFHNKQVSHLHRHTQRLKTNGPASIQDNTNTLTL
jgi:hypothetical protein